MSTGRNDESETRLRRLLTARAPRSPDRPPGSTIEIGTYVIDYAYLKEVRRDTIKLDGGDGADIPAQLRAHRSKIADRMVLIGDLEDTSDQLCDIPGTKPLSGVLIHACSLATLNRGMLFELTDVLSPAASWTILSCLIGLIVGVRVIHAASPRLRAWPYEHLEILVFGSMAIAVIVVCRGLAQTSGVVWPVLSVGRRWSGSLSVRGADPPGGRRGARNAARIRVPDGSRGRSLTCSGADACLARSC